MFEEAMRRTQSRFDTFSIDIQTTLLSPARPIALQPFH